MDIARYLSLEPHSDDFDDELTPAERFSRAQMRAEYESWRRDNPFDDVLDFALHVVHTQQQGVAA
jgi:hypothetical protein